MKVLAVSEDPRLLEELRLQCEGIQGIAALECHAGAIEEMRSLPGRGEVDVLLLDCRQDGVARLAAVERLSAQSTALNTFLMVDHDSPELLLRALRLGIREVIRVPLAHDDLKAAFTHHLSRARGAGRDQGQVSAFVACKGGSGATFLATNMAYALAEQAGKRVLLIDLNLQFGDAVLYVSDRSPPATLPDVLRDVQRLDLSLLESASVKVTPQFSIIAAPDDPTHAMDVRPVQIEALIRFARSHFDHVILDLGRSLDTCTVQALDLADHVYPVLQLTLPFLRDAKRLFEVFRSLDYADGKVRPLLNRVERAAGEITRADAEKLLSYPVFHTVPNHYRSVTSSVNQGVPILKFDRASPVSRSISEIVGELTNQKPVEGGGGVLRRLFSRP